MLLISKLFTFLFTLNLLVLKFLVLELNL